MKTILIVDKVSLQIQSRYEADAADQSRYGGPWGDPRQTLHIEVPEDIDPAIAKIEQIEEEVIGQVQISFQVAEDSELKTAALQAGRNAKLALLRAKRNELLVKSDYMVNELVLGLRADSPAIASYRQELLDITESYKKVNGDAKATIDSLDIEEAFPEAPSAE